jgi:hypothetical protein
MAITGFAGHVGILLHADRCVISKLRRLEWKGSSSDADEVTAGRDHSRA